MNSEGKHYLSALDQATKLINGFESPFGLELLATIDWILSLSQCEPTVFAVKDPIAH